MLRPFRWLRALCLPLLGALAAGCATITGTPDQHIQLQTVDARGQPMQMRCRLSNDAAEYVGDSPMSDLVVRRSGADLHIECRHGAITARGTAVSHAGGALSAVLPGGTAGILIDHISGYRYSYPDRIRLRVGEDLVFDNAREGRAPPPMQAEK